MSTPDDKLKRAVLAQVASLRDYLIETTRELVQIPSVNHPPTGDEFSCQIAVAGHLRDAGLEPVVYYLNQVDGLERHREFWPGRDYTCRPNVVARRQGARGGRSLVLSGHIDTVPLGSRPWKRDPFAGEISDGKLYGLGAYDMKGGVALILGVLRTLHDLGIDLAGDLIAETVVDEEFGGANGTLAGRVRGDNGDAMIITEPSGLQINNGVRGGLEAQITLSGQEGIFFGETEPGQAVRQLAHLLKWIDVLRARRRERWPHAAGEPDPVPVMVTKIYSGVWGMSVPITLPAEIKVELYWQFVPGEEEQQVKEEFFAWLDEMAKDDPSDFSARPRVEFPIRFMPASEIAADAPIIRSLSDASETVTRASPTVSPLPAPSDLYLPQREFGMQAVHYGAGGAGAHSADEYVLIDDLVTATQVLALTALDWCGVC